ncbi:MAG: 50S ribosomal protein L17 [Dehalococcoidia bacterium]|uniref:50S ribosomal protein L17 n=1 Tax=Candidatus Amarobacter glycogenicus TaxID=3140699 RepID=UPI00313636F3|nr:50S ribosomal protein L17 [Dehalococcoidia bacterium]
MRHRVAGRHLGRDTAHRLSLYRNLVTDLLKYERITTTEAKAKEIRPMAERIITLGRRGDLHARRQAMKFVFDPGVVKKVFDDLGPRMASRPGGYLRITGLEPRKGDGAKMATIELVDFVDAPPTPRPQRVTAAPSAPARPTAGAAAAAAVAAEIEASAVEAEAEVEVPETVAEVEATADAVVEEATSEAAAEDSEGSSEA